MVKVSAAKVLLTTLLIEEVWIAWQWAYTRHCFQFKKYIASLLNIIPVLLYVQSYAWELRNFFRFNFKHTTKPVHDPCLEDLRPCK